MPSDAESTLRGQWAFGVYDEQGDEGAKDVLWRLSELGLTIRLVWSAGYPMVELAEDPEFNAGYLLQGMDVAAVKAFFTPKARGFFTSRRNRNYCVQADGQALYCLHRNRRFRPDQARDILKEAFEFRDLFMENR